MTDAYVVTTVTHADSPAYNVADGETNVIFLQSDSNLTSPCVSHQDKMWFWKLAMCLSLPVDRFSHRFRVTQTDVRWSWESSAWCKWDWNKGRVWRRVWSELRQWKQVRKVPSLWPTLFGCSHKSLQVCRLGFHYKYISSEKASSRVFSSSASKKQKTKRHQIHNESTLPLRNQLFVSFYCTQQTYSNCGWASAV